MKSDLSELLMPGGIIPLPVFEPPAARTAGNLFDMRSRKLGRDLFLDSELEWLNAKKIDANPDVLWFCEHYPQKKVWVKTRWKTTVFDMLICFKCGRFLLQEVKYKADSKPQPGTDIWWQLQAQKIWSADHAVDYEIADEIKICKNELELKNVKKILGLLTESPPESLCVKVLDLIGPLGACSMRTVIAAMKQAHEDDVIRTVCYLILKGLLSVPIHEQPFTKAIILYRC